VWSDDEIEKLKEYYINNETIENIAIKLNRTKNAIRNKAYKLEITNGNYWTEAEIKYLKENYKSYNLQEISDYLKKNKTNVCRKAKQLDIERNHKKFENTKGTIDESSVWHKNGWIRKTDEEIALKRSKIMIEWHETHEHPKGMLNKKHSLETKNKFSERMKKDWKDKNSTYNSDNFRQLKSDLVFNRRLNSNSISNYSRAKSGKRSDLNDKFFRSSWEANYARYLNLLIKQKQIKKWEYECDTFIFEEIKRGIRSYTPDFKIWENDDSYYYIEIKGWMDDKSKVKLNRMKKYYPNEKIIIIQKQEYNEIKNKLSAIIKGWE